MENSTEVLWIKLLPDQLKGGPKSNFQRKLKEAEAAKVAAPNVISFNAGASEPISGKAMGGSVHTEKFKHLAEELKAEGRGQAAFPIATSILGYKGSVKAGHRRKPGFGTGGYTGDEGDAVKADKVHSVKSFEDHEGEYYVNAPTVAVLGGPEEVEKLITDHAKRRVIAAGAGNYQNKAGLPIMSKSESPKSYQPKSNIRPSFAPGGPVDIYGGNPDQGKETVNPTDVAWANQQLSGNVPMGTPNPTPLAVAKPAALSFVRSRSRRIHRIEPMNPPAETPSAAENKPIAPTGEMPKGAQTISQTYTGPNFDVGAAANLPADGTTSGATILANTPISGTRDIKYGTDYLRGIAEGNNPAIQAMINTALQKNGANTAAGKAELQMRLGQQGITGPAADAAMESFDRNARVGRSTLQSTMVQNEMNQGQAAAQDLITAGQTERSYQTGNLNAEMTAALAAGDFGAYSAAYQKVHGSLPDTATLQAEFKNAQVQTATKNLNTAMIATGQATDLNTPGVRTNLVTIYKANGGQGEPTDDQLNGLLADAKHGQDPVWQMQNGGISDDAILSQYFGGDQGSLDRFEVNGQTGIAAFKAYIPEMFKGGIDVTTDPATGARTLKYNWDNPVMQKFLHTTSPTEVFATLPSTYTPVRDKFVMKDNKLYSMTKDAAGFHVGMTAETPKTDASTHQVTFGGTLISGVTNEGTDAAPKYKKDGKEITLDFTKLDANGLPTQGTAALASAQWSTPTQARTGISNAVSADYPNYVSAVGGNLTLDGDVNDEDALKHFADLKNPQAIADYSRLIAEKAMLPVPTDPTAQQQLVDSQNPAKMAAWVTQFQSDPTVLSGISSSSPFYQGIRNNLIGFNGANQVVGSYMAINPGGESLIGKAVSLGSGGGVVFQAPDGTQYRHVNLVGKWEWDKLGVDGQWLLMSYS